MIRKIYVKTINKQTILQIIYPKQAPVNLPPCWHNKISAMNISKINCLQVEYYELDFRFTCDKG